jgi:YegS/Rv2252/BmrU family lipid kinase
MKSLIILISNPAAKKASDRRVAMASYYLQSKGYTVEMLFTERRGDAEQLAREYVQKSPFLIIAAGGDGTINEVMNGIAGTEIPLAILPLGTTNVLARELGIPENVESAVKTALSKNPVPVCLGKIDCISNANSVSRYFMLMAGIGFDGESVFGTNEAIKKISGKGAYIFSGIKSLSSFKPNTLSFSIEGKTFSGYSVIIGNISRYGGDFRVTPDARITDPFLHVCVFQGEKRIDVLRYVFGITAGRHLKYHDIQYLKAESVEIQGQAHVQVDGDYLGVTPAKVEIVRDALRLVF